jgi:hypothetical protein
VSRIRWIGLLGPPDYEFSLQELEQVLTRVLDELRQMDTEEETLS